MAKKKKGNMRNIQPGATVQFLNYLTPDHILRGKYNIGNNELDITDVPANLNSVITLGQGGGATLKPLIKANYKVNVETAFIKPVYTYLYIGNSAAYYDGSIYTVSSPDFYDIVSPNTTKEITILPVFGYNGETCASEGFVFELTDGSEPQSISATASNTVNCSWSSDNFTIIVTDPTKDASLDLDWTITY